MTRKYVWLSLAIFLVAALVCLHPGGLHCEQAQTCQLLAGISAVLTGVVTVVTIAFLLWASRRTRPAPIGGLSHDPTDPRTNSQYYPDTSIQSFLRVFLL